LKEIVMGLSTVSYDLRASRSGNPAPKAQEEQPTETEGGGNGNGQGIVPLAVGPVLTRTTNYSFAPGYAWCEMTNPAAIVVAAGTQSIFGDVNRRGSGQLLQVLKVPAAAIVIAPTTYPMPPDPNETGMSVNGFPGPPKSLPVETSLPTGVGIHTVELDQSVDPAHVVIHFRGTGGTIPAGQRWLIFTLVGI
jgi:hypothetical protein